MDAEDAKVISVVDTNTLVVVKSDLSMVKDYKFTVKAKINDNQNVFKSLNVKIYDCSSKSYTIMNDSEPLIIEA